MSGQRTKVQCGIVHTLGAMLLLGACSLAQAAPRTVPNPAANSHPLDTTLPVPAITKPRAQPVVALDEPRPVLPNARELPSAAEAETRAQQQRGALDIRWRESREIAGPDVVSLIRNYRRDGLPVVQLFQSHQSLVAIGVNPHGLPGIYFRRNVGG